MISRQAIVNSVYIISKKTLPTEETRNIASMCNMPN